MIHTEAKILLRKEDVDECALNGWTPEEALAFCINNSTQSYAVMKNEEILCYWGWAPSTFAVGGCKAWMLSTPAIENHKVHAARRSQQLLELLLLDHFSIDVLVDPRYDIAKRWLSWLGFRRVGFRYHCDEMRITRGSRC